MPMFGFPTRERPLHTVPAWFKDAREPLSRDLDIAISEFAPGNELVQDKAQHLVVGLVHYGPRGKETPDPVGPLADAGVCQECSAAHLGDVGRVMHRVRCCGRQVPADERRAAPRLPHFLLAAGLHRATREPDVRDAPAAGRRHRSKSGRRWATSRTQVARPSRERERQPRKGVQVRQVRVRTSKYNLSGWSGQPRRPGELWARIARLECPDSGT